MSSWQTGDLQVNTVKIHYTRTGGNKPSLVLAHGFTDDGLCWTPIAEILEPDYDVIMVDARGHGLSDAPETGYTAQNQAADLNGVISALGLHKPAVLGHSMGAVTALMLAGTFPDVPGAILLEDPPPWWYPPARPPHIDPQRVANTRESFRQRQLQTREQLIEAQRRDTPNWSDAELGPWADSKLRHSLNIVQFLDPSVPTSVDWPALTKRITCPALLITADIALGSIVSPEAATALRGLIPQLRVAHIAGAGHSIHREQLTIYMDTIKVFLAGLQS